VVGLDSDLTYEKLSEDRIKPFEAVQRLLGTQSGYETFPKSAEMDAW